MPVNFSRRVLYPLDKYQRAMEVRQRQKKDLEISNLSSNPGSSTMYLLWEVEQITNPLWVSQCWAVTKEVHSSALALTLRSVIHSTNIYWAPTVCKPQGHWHKENRQGAYSPFLPTALPPQSLVQAPWLWTAVGHCGLGKRENRKRGNRLWRGLPGDAEDQLCARN